MKKPDPVTLRLEEINAEEHRGRHAGPIDRAEYERNHYLATLTYRHRSARYRFTTGSGWHRPPVAREVLESVLSDSSMLEQADTLEEAREAIRDSFGDDAGNVDDLARALLAADKKTRRLLGADYREAIADPNGWVWEHTDEPPATLERSDRTPGTRRASFTIGTAKEGYRVRIEIELRDTEKGLELSVSGSTPYSGGQIRDELDQLETLAEGWTPARVAELARIWDTWHLNTMNAGCQHQRALRWTYDEHPSEPCPECGYRMGSAWLFEPLPADVLEWLEQLPGLERARATA